MNVIRRHIRDRLGSAFLLLAVVAGTVGLLAGCSNAWPSRPAGTPFPPPSPVAAVTRSATSMARTAPHLPAPSPTSARRVAPGDLIAPADLTFDGAYPVSGWRRCDDYSVDRNLERYRQPFAVTSSVAAVWEYGAGCAGASAEIRVDAYAWLVRDEAAADQLVQQLEMDAYLSNLAPELLSKIREFEREGVGVRSLTRPRDDGTTQYVAEIIGRRGSAIAYARLITVKALTDDEYLVLGRRYLERVAGPDIPAGSGRTTDRRTVRVTRIITTDESPSATGPLSRTKIGGLSQT